MKSEKMVLDEIENRISSEVKAIEILYPHINPNAPGELIARLARHNVRIETLQSLRDWITSDDAADAGKGEVKDG